MTEQLTITGKIVSVIFPRDNQERTRLAVVDGDGDRHTLLISQRTMEKSSRPCTLHTLLTFDVDLIGHHNHVLNVR